MGERYQLTGTWPCKCRDKANAMGVLECRVCHATRPGNGREVSKAVARTQSETPAGTKTPPPAPNAPKRRKRGPNDNEARYNSVHLDGLGLFEGLRFSVAGGHRYTPDLVAQYHGRLVIVEVKDARRHHFSHQRSRLAFDTARREWAWLRARWVWAEWDGTKFDEETYDTLEHS